MVECVNCHAISEIFLTLQFALHYSWSTEARARRALANVSALLRPGGTFIGTMPDANVIIKKLREGTWLELCLATPFFLVSTQNYRFVLDLMSMFDRTNILLF